MATTKTKKKPAKKTTRTKERAVLVTTAHRGRVLRVRDEDGRGTIKLRAARNCIYWHQSVRGFLGLASTGPNSQCRVGPPADIELRAITCVAEVSDEAVMAWEAQPWA